MSQSYLLFPAFVNLIQFLVKERGESAPGIFRNVIQEMTLYILTFSTRSELAGMTSPGEIAKPDDLIGS